MGRIAKIQVCPSCGEEVAGFTQYRTHLRNCPAGRPGQEIELFPSMEEGNNVTINQQERHMKTEEKTSGSGNAGESMMEMLRDRTPEEKEAKDRESLRSDALNSCAATMQTIQMRKEILGGDLFDSLPIEIKNMLILGFFKNAIVLLDKMGQVGMFNMEDIIEAYRKKLGENGKAVQFPESPERATLQQITDKLVKKFTASE